MKTEILGERVWKPEVMHTCIFDMQVCVPKHWTDVEVTCFANQENPSGTANGWNIRREGHKYLAGDPERNPCSSRADYVHITLET